MNYIRLRAIDLKNKFGFEDGDVLENHGFDVSNDVLVKLVERYLLPTIGRDVKTYTLSSLHNPIGLAEGEELIGKENDVFVDVSYEQIQGLIGLPDKITEFNAEYIRADIVAIRDEALIDEAWYLGKENIHSDIINQTYLEAGLEKLK